MPRPVLKRNAKSYQRDIESLGRLRTALVIDPDLSPSRVESTRKAIDKLLTELGEIVKPLTELEE